MSLQWEPQWEEVLIEYHGIRLKVLRDKVTGLYACPICGTGDHATYIFTPKDLVYHIYAHAKQAEKHTTRIRVEEEREEEEE